MSDWTQAQLDALIVCPKRITVPPKAKMAAERGSLRNGMELASADDKHRFRVFMRINEAFPENFSIGLVVLAKDAEGVVEIHLIRCNGPHEGPVEPAGTPTGVPNWHFGYHIHRAKADNLDSGLRAERGAETTKEYGSFQEALAYFLKTCGVQGCEAYFKDLMEPRLFDQTESPGGD